MTAQKSSLVSRTVFTIAGLATVFLFLTYILKLSSPPADVSAANMQQQQAAQQPK